MADLVMVVPTRGRPWRIPGLVAAWRDTATFPDATLLLATDADDPHQQAYTDVCDLARRADPGLDLRILVFEQRRPMVDKLDACALTAAQTGAAAVGFAGDDHLPGSYGWARALHRAATDPTPGVAWGDDLHRGPDLPTHWVMDSRIITTLGVMVPAPVQHQFCDRAVLDLATAAGCARYLPEVIVEHRHYAAGKALKDPGYRAVNSKAQFEADRDRYRRWRGRDLPVQATAVRDLIQAAA